MQNFEYSLFDKINNSEKIISFDELDKLFSNRKLKLKAVLKSDEFIKNMNFDENSVTDNPFCVLEYLNIFNDELDINYDIKQLQNNNDFTNFDEMISLPSN